MLGSTISSLFQLLAKLFVFAWHHEAVQRQVATSLAHSHPYIENSCKALAVRANHYGRFHIRCCFNAWLQRAARWARLTPTLLGPNARSVQTALQQTCWSAWAGVIVESHRRCQAVLEHLHAKRIATEALLKVSRADATAVMKGYWLDWVCLVCNARMEARNAEQHLAMGLLQRHFRAMLNCWMRSSNRLPHFALGLIQNSLCVFLFQKNIVSPTKSIERLT